MKNFSLEDIILRKAVLDAALRKKTITKEIYDEANEQLNKMEAIAKTEKVDRLNKINKMSNDFNLYATN